MVNLVVYTMQVIEYMYIKRKVSSGYDSGLLSQYLIMTSF